MSDENLAENYTQFVWDCFVKQTEKHPGTLTRVRIPAKVADRVLVLTKRDLKDKGLKQIVAALGDWETHAEKVIILGDVEIWAKIAELKAKAEAKNNTPEKPA